MANPGGRLHPAILCGGGGMRLWPLSQGQKAKALLRLLSDRSLLQETLARLAAVEGAVEPIVMAGAVHADPVRQQLAETGLRARTLVEPVGRDTMAAVLAIALLVAETDATDLVLVVASDHYLPDADAFARAVQAARPAAEAGRIVTFGLRPTGPSASYGYIAPGTPLPTGGGVLSVKAFAEKPDPATAADFVAEGRLWNTGNFLFRAGDLIDEARRHAPEVLAAVTPALSGAGRKGAEIRLGDAFAAAPRLAFDKAIMEHTTRAAVLPVDYAWSDVGAWDAVWANSARDAEGNAVSGTAVVRDLTDSLVVAGEGVQLIALGLRNIAVIAVEGRVLVADLARTPELKPLVEALRRR